MEKEIKREIEEIDRVICEKYALTSKKNIYRRFGSSYIKSGPWPLAVYKNIKTHSELSVIPSTYKRRWMNLLLKNFRSSEENYSFTDLSGPFFGWFFLGRYFFRVQANFIFYKEFRKGVVLLYEDLDFVLKGKILADSDFTKWEYERTKEAYQDSMKIGILKVPAVYFHFYAPNKYSFFLQERFIGTTLNRFSRDIVSENLKKMCDFLFLFYQKNEVSLKIPEIELKEIEDVLNLFYEEEYISKFESILDYFKLLQLTGKKCFWGKTHGDIHTRNLALDKNNELWLIDWQASKQEFLALDLRKIKDNDNLFNNLLTLFPSRQYEIMSKIDQVFIGNLLYLQRKILQQKEKRFYQAEQSIDLLIDYCKKHKLISTNKYIESSSSSVNL